MKKDFQNNQVATKTVEICESIMKNSKIITRLYLFHKGEIQVIRSTNAQVQNIHTGSYCVVKCIQEP